jgi:hypothetical protein
MKILVLTLSFLLFVGCVTSYETTTTDKDLRAPAVSQRSN